MSCSIYRCFGMPTIGDIKSRCKITTFSPNKCAHFKKKCVKIDTFDRIITIGIAYVLPTYCLRINTVHSLCGKIVKIKENA